MVVEKALVSYLVIWLMPDLPASMLSHVALTPIPTGETTPRPVTTTLRLDIKNLLDIINPETFY
jgi:hypothetical protein